MRSTDDLVEDYLSKANPSFPPKPSQDGPDDSGEEPSAKPGESMAGGDDDGEQGQGKGQIPKLPPPSVHESAANLHAALSKISHLGEKGFRSLHPGTQKELLDAGMIDASGYLTAQGHQEVAQYFAAHAANPKLGPEAQQHASMRNQAHSEAASQGEGAHEHWKMKQAEMKNGNGGPPQPGMAPPQPGMPPKPPMAGPGQPPGAPPMAGKPPMLPQAGGPPQGAPGAVPPPHGAPGGAQLQAAMAQGTKLAPPTGSPAPGAKTVPPAGHGAPVSASAPNQSPENAPPNEGAPTAHGMVGKPPMAPAKPAHAMAPPHEPQAPHPAMPAQPMPPAGQPGVPPPKPGMPPMAKSMAGLDELGDYLEKAMGGERSGHKYIKREGSPGSYKYTYRPGHSYTAEAFHAQTEGASAKQHRAWGDEARGGGDPYLSAAHRNMASYLDTGAPRFKEEIPHNLGQHYQVTREKPGDHVHHVGEVAAKVAELKARPKNPDAHKLTEHFKALRSGGAHTIKVGQLASDTGMNVDRTKAAIAHLGYEIEPHPEHPHGQVTFDYHAKHDLVPPDAGSGGGAKGKFGDNKWIVHEHISGQEPVVRAGQATREGAEKYMKPGRSLSRVREDGSLETVIPHDVSKKGGEEARKQGYAEADKASRKIYEEEIAPKGDRPGSKGYDPAKSADAYSRLATEHHKMASFSSDPEIAAAHTKIGHRYQEASDVHKKQIGAKELPTGADRKRLAWPGTTPSTKEAPKVEPKPTKPAQGELEHGTHGPIKALMQHKDYRQLHNRAVKAGQAVALLEHQGKKGTPEYAKARQKMFHEQQGAAYVASVHSGSKDTAHQAIQGITGAVNEYREGLKAGSGGKGGGDKGGGKEPPNEKPASSFLDEARQIHKQFLRHPDKGVRADKAVAISHKASDLETRAMNATPGGTSAPFGLLPDAIAHKIEEHPDWKMASTLRDIADGLKHGGTPEHNPGHNADVMARHAASVHAKMESGEVKPETPKAGEGSPDIKRLPHETAYSHAWTKDQAESTRDDANKDIADLGLRNNLSTDEKERLARQHFRASAAHKRIGDLSQGMTEKGAHAQMTNFHHKAGNRIMDEVDAAHKLEAKAAQPKKEPKPAKPVQGDLFAKKSMSGLTGLGDYLRKSAEQIPGGLASGKSPKDFDSKALAAGIKVEMEHTGKRAVAQEIAMDHLTEDPRYYEKLARMEKSDGKADAAITELLQRNPRPDDSQVHALAGKLGMEVDNLEERIYAMAAKAVEKCMNKSGLNELGEYLEKSDGMPDKGDWDDIDKPAEQTLGGSANGGDLTDHPGTSGNGTSGPGEGQDEKGQLTGVSEGQQEILGDDRDPAQQMTPGTAALQEELPEGYKSLTPAAQREMVAKEHAMKVAQLQKSTDVTVGAAHPLSMQTIHGNTDAEAEALLKSDFYHGASPTLAQPGSVLRQSVLCKSEGCGCKYSAMLTACPACGSGTTVSRMLPRSAYLGGGDAVRLEKSTFDPLLRPAPVDADVSIPGASPVVFRRR